MRYEHFTSTLHVRIAQDLTGHHARAEQPDDIVILNGHVDIRLDNGQVAALQAKDHAVIVLADAAVLYAAPVKGVALINVQRVGIQAALRLALGADILSERRRVGALLKAEAETQRTQVLPLADDIDRVPGGKRRVPGGHVLSALTVDKLYNIDAEATTPAEILEALSGKAGRQREGIHAELFIEPLLIFAAVGEVLELAFIEVCKEARLNIEVGRGKPAHTRGKQQRRDYDRQQPCTTDTGNVPKWDEGDEGNEQYPYP